MALRKMTIMVDEADLELMNSAAGRLGRPESECFREAFHLVAVRTRIWDEDWDIPVLGWGQALTGEVNDTVQDHLAGSNPDAG
ncbi:CopG family transcriptional regulator [Nocardia takedensis]